ncbi:hypothetical protein GQ600_3542 [Phytophthora cactorum]|nr:hypothetical protein GQ600_3542 [Phytophthora cactorum]
MNPRLRFYFTPSLSYCLAEELGTGPASSGPASRKSCAGINRSFRARGVGALRQAGTLSARANSNAEKLTSKSNGDASVVQLSPFLGSIGGYTKDTADFRKQAGPRLLVLQYRAQHDHSIACVLPAV